MVVAKNRRLSLGPVTHNRFVDRLERRNGRWGIVDHASIYDFSSFTFPAGLPKASGFAVTGSFPLKDSDAERDIKNAGSRWLYADSNDHTAGIRPEGNES